MLHQQWKNMAMYQFDMAVYTKIFLKFPRKFWPDGPGTEFFLYASSRRGYFPVWQVINKFDYAKQAPVVHHHN